MERDLIMDIFDELYNKRNETEPLSFSTCKSLTNNKLASYLEKLPPKEITRIIKNLTLTFFSENINDKINFIANNIDNTIETFTNLMNLTHYDFVLELINSNGILAYKPKYLGFVRLFFLYGFCFPITNNNNKYIVMPTDVVDKFKALPEMTIYIIEQNTLITKYVRGLINLFGIIEVTDILNYVNRFMKRPVDYNTVISLIHFDSIANLYIIKYKEYFVSFFILNRVSEYIKKRRAISQYYKYTDEEIISASDPYYLTCNTLTKHQITNIFNIPKPEAEQLMRNLTFALKEDIHFSLLTTVLKSINRDNLDQKIACILNINENVPKWSLKGHKYSDTKKQNPLTMKKLLELII